MDDTISTDNYVVTSDYVRRLLAERHYIYAKLYNQGGSVILRQTDIVDHDRPVGYSTEIGNSFHLDLIQLEIQFDALVKSKELSRQEVLALISWADGLTAQQAADYIHAKGAISVRKQRSRGTRKLTESLNERSG